MDQAMQAAGSVISGVAGYEAGKYNRQVSRNAAVQAERDGTAVETQIRDAARMQIGQQVAAQGSNGFQQGTGSAIDALTQSQINATLDALNARRSAAGKARALIAQGDQAYASGENALVGSLIGAGGKIKAASSDWASAKAGQTMPTNAYGVAGSDGLV